MPCKWGGMGGLTGGRRPVKKEGEESDTRYCSGEIAAQEGH